MRIKSTRYFEQSTPSPAPPAPDPQCGLARLSQEVSPAALGEAEAAGFRTIVIQTRTRLGNGEVSVRKEWKAPELDCTTLQMTEERYDSGGNVTGRLKIEPVRVAAGSPDPTLFALPADYAEKPPSEMHAAVAGQIGSANTPGREQVRQRLQREDAAYFANHRTFGK